MNSEQQEKSTRTVEDFLSDESEEDFLSDESEEDFLSDESEEDWLKDGNFISIHSPTALNALNVLRNRAIAARKKFMAQERKIVRIKNELEQAENRLEVLRKADDKAFVLAVDAYEKIFLPYDKKEKLIAMNNDFKEMIRRGEIKPGKPLSVEERKKREEACEKRFWRAFAKRGNVPKAKKGRPRATNEPYRRSVGDSILISDEKDPFLWWWFPGVGLGEDVIEREIQRSLEEDNRHIAQRGRPRKFFPTDEQKTWHDKLGDAEIRYWCGCARVKGRGEAAKIVGTWQARQEAAAWYGTLTDEEKRLWEARGKIGEIVDDEGRLCAAWRAWQAEQLTPP
jgi:hypothetical protein